MLPLPSRSGLATLSEAANAVAACLTVGFVRTLDAASVSYLYSSPHGMGEYLIPLSDLPAPLLPGTPGLRRLGAEEIRANALRPIEWQMTSAFPSVDR